MKVQNLVKSATMLAVAASLLVIASCVSCNSQSGNRAQPQDVSQFQTASVHVVDADSGLPLAGVRIRHSGDLLHSQRDDGGLQLLGRIEFVTTNANGDARLQRLGNGDGIDFSLDFVDVQNVYVAYYTSGTVRSESLQLIEYIVHPHSFREDELRVVLDPQQALVVRMHRSFGGPADPPAQQCLCELHALKPGMRDSDADQFLKNHGFRTSPPATLPAPFSAVSKGYDSSEKHKVYLSERYPQLELHLRLRDDFDKSDQFARRYRLDEWYIANLNTGTRTEDADVRQAWPKY